MSFNTLPSKASLQPAQFTAHVSDEALDDFKHSVKSSKIGPATYENLKDDRSFGISREWLSGARQYWLNQYNWRETESRINSFPNFTVPIEYNGDNYNVHFAALFSQKADAAPIVFLHGWPGSFLEFLSLLHILRDKYRPEDLPFHAIVPSLPGYGYSSGPPLDKDFTVEDASNIIDKLMAGLGFADGYIAQGGDVGSFICRILGVGSESCKAVHLNMSPSSKRSDVPPEAITEEEKVGLQRSEDFNTYGSAYAREHGTRPATIGLVLSTSPVALLAWISEKFQQWTDTDPPLNEILDSVTLYWFTDSFPRCIYPYRQLFGPNAKLWHRDPNFYLKVPTGFSWFPKELSPPPKAWVEKTCNMVWFKRHKQGGHFAAMEQPQDFLDDIEDFVAKVWKRSKPGQASML